MGKHFIVFIFLCIAMTSITFSAEDSVGRSIDWKTVEKDVQDLSRASFFAKYRGFLKEAGIEVKKQGQLLSAEQVVRELDAVEEIFYAKGYSQWKEVKEIKDEFSDLYESSAGSYAVLKRRIYDFNLKTFKNKSISQKLRGQVNENLSDLSKKIDKHHQAKSSLPSRAVMVAALGNQFAPKQTTLKSVGQESFFSKVTARQWGYAVGGIAFLILVSGYRRRVKRLRREARANEEEVLIPGEGLTRTGVITVNGRGQVETMNLRASALFKGYVKCGDQWDNFFQENFYKGKKHLGVKGFYRFAQNSKSIYYVNGQMDKVSQMRTIEVAQMALKDFDQALALMERSSIRVDSMELFDSVFSELINLNKIELSLDVFNLLHFGRGSDYLYLSEFEGKKYFTQVLKIIDAFGRFKNSGELSRIDIDREGSEFLIRATLSHCSISETDLKEVVVFEQKKVKVNDVLASFQNLSQSYESSLFVKNLTINGERKVELKFKIQDNSNFQSIHRVKNVKVVGRDTNA